MGKTHLLETKIVFSFDFFQREFVLISNMKYVRSLWHVVVSFVNTWSFRRFKSYFGFLSNTFCSFFTHYSLPTYMVRSICVDPIANIVYVSSSTQFEFARDASKSTNLKILFFFLPHNLSDVLLRSFFINSPNNSQHKFSTSLAFLYFPC